MGKLRQVNGNFYQDDYMTFEEILDLIKELSRSQGFYGRLLRDINDLEDEELGKLKEHWEEMHFKDNLDFILFLES